MWIRFARTALAALVFTACTEGITTVPLDQETPADVGQALVDGSQPDALVPGFYFLPPTVSAPPPDFMGDFDPGLEPTVEICELDGLDPVRPTDCSTAPVASLQASLAEPKNKNDDPETYRLNWRSTLEVGTEYRAFVVVNGTVLGYLDLLGTRSPSDGAPEGFVPISEGRPFLFRFRIETGIAGSVEVTPSAASISDLEGEAQQFIATVLDLHGDPLPDVLVDWSLSDDDVAILTPESSTTDGAGVATTTATPNALVAQPTDVTVIAMAQSSMGQAVLTITPAPGRPLGQPDVFAVVQGQTLSVPAPGILGNDVDLQGDAILVSAVTEDAAHGTLTVEPDGSFTYVPEAGFLGTDSFVYAPIDGSGNVGLPVPVQIEVVEPSDTGPRARPDQFLVVQGTTLSAAAPGFLANDLDPKGGPISGVAILDSPDNGSLNAFPDGSFTYTPAAGFVGTDQFTYRMRDGDFNTDEATVTIEVLKDPDRAPLALDDNYVAFAGTPLSIGAEGFLANDLDPDGAPVSGVAILDSPDNGSLNAFPDGSFTYTPAAGFTGTDQFTYRMRDPDFNTDEATVTIQVVTPSSPNPVATDDEFAVVEGNALMVPMAGFLLNDVDPEGAPVSGVAILDSPDNGSLVAFPDGSFTYTPTAGFTGTDQFTYRMRDPDFNTDEATVSIQVLEDPDKNPLATDDEYIAIEGTALSVVAAGFLANDLDPDGAPVSGVAILDSPDNGSLVAFPDGRFTYTPTAGFTGTDQFTYRMRDPDFNTDEATVTIQVLEDPNQPPVTLDDFYAVLQGTPLNVTAPGFLSNDLDREGGAVSGVAIMDSPDNGSLVAFPDGSFTYTPATGFVGTDQFVYRARDPEFNTGEATVTIEVLDEALATASAVVASGSKEASIRPSAPGEAEVGGFGAPLPIGDASTVSAGPLSAPPAALSDAVSGDEAVSGPKPLPVRDNVTPPEVPVRYPTDPAEFAAGKTPLPGSEG